MGRHQLATSRRPSSAVLVAAIAPAAVLFAVGGDVHSLSESRIASPVAEAAKPVVEDIAPPCCLEVVAAPVAFASALTGAAGGEAAMSLFANPLPAASSRWRVDDRPRLLPVGVALEQGLQVRTILTARSISAVFPEIHHIGGVRPDALRWHPDGLALDVMVPNPTSIEGIALGNEIVAYVLKNAKRFGMQDAIWRGTYYTPNGPRGSGAGHFDHIHITTTGGGYPTGGEVYAR